MYVEEIEIYQNYVSYLKKAHVWCLKILTWLRGFRFRIANFSRLHFLAIPRRELNTKKTKTKTENDQKRLESCLNLNISNAGY